MMKTLSPMIISRSQSEKYQQNSISLVLYLKQFKHETSIYRIAGRTIIHNHRGRHVFDLVKNRIKKSLRHQALTGHSLNDSNRNLRRKKGITLQFVRNRFRRNIPYLVWRNHENFNERIISTIKPKNVKKKSISFVFCILNNLNM